MEFSVQSVMQFLAAHPPWVALGTFAVAFGEALMIVSFVFPGMAIVVVAGALIFIGNLAVLPFLIGGMFGAIWFFEHHGAAGIVIDRFFGPLRATVPLAAGISHMRGRGAEIRGLIVDDCGHPFRRFHRPAFGLSQVRESRE